MVSFVCGSCSEVLKKAQVARHLYNCHANSLACLDCNVDFSRNGYNEHNKCITEAQKYHGSTYVSKVNKGEVKQANWAALVAKASDFTKDIKALSLLKAISSYDNTPRKKEKFCNFVSNCLHCKDRRVMEIAFDAIKAAEEHEKSLNGANESANGSNGNAVNGKDSKEEPKPNNQVKKDHTDTNGNANGSNDNDTSMIVDDQNGNDTAADNLNLNELNIDLPNGEEPDGRRRASTDAAFNFAFSIACVLSGQKQPTNYFKLCEDLVKKYREATGDFIQGDHRIVYAICDTLEQMKNVSFVGDTDNLRYTGANGKK